MRDRQRWLGGPLGCELPMPGPAVGAGAQGVGIQEGLHTHPTGSASGWVRGATRVVTNSYQATKLPAVTAPPCDEKGRRVSRQPPILPRKFYGAVCRDAGARPVLLVNPQWVRCTWPLMAPCHQPGGRLTCLLRRAAERAR